MSWPSNTPDKGFCVEALQESLDRYGVLQILNAGQGRQFAGAELTYAIKARQIQISRDGKGQRVGNVFGERLRWRLQS